MITAEELAKELYDAFASWVGTPSEELLEDGGTVIDHLKDRGNYAPEELETIPENVWETAWELFYCALLEGRGASS